MKCMVPQRKTLKLSPLDVGLLYLTLSPHHSSIVDQSSMVGYMAARFAECGWKVISYELGTWKAPLVINFVSDPEPKAHFHEWELMIGVERVLMVAYRPVSPTGRPLPFKMPAAARRLTFILGAGAAVILATMFVMSWMHQRAARTNNVVVTQPPPPSAPATAPPAAAAPQPAPSSSVPTAATAGHPAQNSAPASPAAAPEVGPGTARMGGPTPASAPPPPPPPKAVETKAKLKFTEPVRTAVTSMGVQSDQSVAKAVLKAVHNYPSAPVIYLDYGYRLSGGTSTTIERWWFDVRDDYIHHELTEQREGRTAGRNGRVLGGNVLKRVDSAATGDPMGFRLSDKETWTVGTATREFLFERTFKALREAGFGPDLIVKAAPGKTADEVILTVSQAWLALPYERRMTMAHDLWQHWWGPRFPLPKDNFFVRLVDSKGQRVGGSGLLGEAIYVAK